MTTQWPVVKEFLVEMRQEIQKDIEHLNNRIASAQKQLDDDRATLLERVNAEAEVSLWLKEHADQQDI